ncbi:AAA family ATPase [Enterococcus sp. 669A]|uniref:AAA family ATPase n=1 Tax=Candidatus Enterococcus moelleringii TaxID=2815325 RepID=A0ABS3LE86_9ENTE|nr:AAA family ATPase [Enterococcus sp. 669A]MBO1307934.1 AAA family ATPase [Enterococcus sp. 669A]
MKKDALNYLPDLVNASFSKDNNSLESVVLSLIRTLARDNDTKKIAEKISGMLAQHQSGLYPDYSSTRTINSSITEDNDFINSYVLKKRSNKDLNSLILNKDIKSKIEDIIAGYRNRDKLAELGLKHSRKIILNGPPGTGKSSIGEAIAKELDLDYLFVNVPSLFSSYLGDSGKNINKLFSLLSEREAVIIFDEFDSLAASRSIDNEVGEMRRIVNTVLTSLDTWEGDGIIIATTNDKSHLDYAIWRRFDEKIDISLPDKMNRLKLWDNYLQGQLSREELQLLAEISQDFSPAEIEIYSQQGLRLRVLKNKPPFLTIMEQMDISEASQKIKAETTLALKENRPDLTTREIADMLGISKSSIQRYLSKAMEE